MFKSKNPQTGGGLQKKNTTEMFKIYDGQLPLSRRVSSRRVRGIFVVSSTGTVGSNALQTGRWGDRRQEPSAARPSDEVPVSKGTSATLSAVLNRNSWNLQLEDRKTVTSKS